MLVIEIYKMHSIVLCVSLFTASVVSCPAPEEATKIYYSPGDSLELDIKQLSFPDDTKTYQIDGQDCDTSSLIPQLQSNVMLFIGNYRRNEIRTTFYDKINSNICSYILKIKGVGWEKQVKLLDVVNNNRGQANADQTSKERYAIVLQVFWVDEPCVDIYDNRHIATDYPKKVPKPGTILIEEEAGVEVQPNCIERSAVVTIISDYAVTIAVLPGTTEKKSTYRIRLHEFDNNTYFKCHPNHYTSSLPETKLTVKMKPATNASVPSYHKVYKYSEHETYEFECVDYNYEVLLRTLYFMVFNGDNRLVSAVSSIESTMFVKSIHLTKEDHNTKLACMIFECRDSDGKRECSRRILNAVTLQMRENHNVEKVPSDKCQLPAYPRNGRYEVFNTPSATPFQVSDFWILDIVCDPGFGILDGENRFHCDTGVWSPANKLPECVPFCKLNPHPSVIYKCQARDNSSLYTRNCNEYEPPGIKANAECKKPEYISYHELPILHCRHEGMWSSSPTCMAACGETTPAGVVKIGDGEYSNLGELPWHVGIYQRTSTPYKQICGGTIVKPSVVISAAHCFWDDKRPDNQKLRPASDFAAAAGKVYREWDHPTDNQYDQKADVVTIDVPNQFLGSLNSFMDDLAVLVLSKSFEYKPHIAPVCLNFNDHFDLIQIAKGVTGKVASWGLNSSNGNSMLKAVDMSIVPYLECYNTSPLSFRRYITGDKICAHYKDKGTAVCKGDSGGGLVVAGSDFGVTRYYLRAVVSAAPDERMASCGANNITAFTHVRKHYTFVKIYLLL